MRLIIDTDTAGDDVFSLLLALCTPGVDLEAITICNGNVAFDQQVENALYTVEQTVVGSIQRSWFSVNLFSDPISQLKPLDRLTLPPTRTTAVQATHPGQLEIWPWIALAALGIVTAEWLAFHRGL